MSWRARTKVRLERPEGKLKGRSWRDGVSTIFFFLQNGAKVFGKGSEIRGMFVFKVGGINSMSIC